MRLLLGQLYDQRAALHLEQRYVGEVLMPQEHLMWCFRERAFDRRIKNPMLLSKHRILRPTG